MDLQRYLHAVRTYWWALVLPLVLGVVLGAVVLSRAEPQHRATVTFFVATSADADAGASAVQADEFARRRVNSYIELLSTDRLAAKVIEASGVDLTPGQVVGMVDANATVDTVLLTATVTHESRALVEQVGDAVATELVDLVDEVDNPGGSLSAQLEVVSGPRLSELAPRQTLIVGIPATFGLLVGLGLAWLLELRDTKIRSETQLRDLNVGPVVGIIPADRRLREPLARRKAVSTAGTESFRQLRTNLEFIDVNSPVRVLVVTSSIAQEGKTTACVNLALAMAAAGKNVLVVQGDLRRPSLDDPLAMGLSAGLTDLIIGRADLTTALQPSGVRGLIILPSGPLPPNPSELLGSDAMVQLLDSLRHRFDTVIINTPPLLPVTDAAVLAAHADGVLVVVRAGKTSRQQLTQAMRSLDAVGARVVGTVLNMTSVQRGPEYAAYWDHATGSPGPAVPGAPGPGGASAGTSDAFRAEAATGRNHRALLRLPPESMDEPGNGRTASSPGTPPAPTAPGRDDRRT